MKIALVSLPLALAGCRSLSPGGPEIPMDPHSFSEPNRVRVTHVDLDLALDFERGIASGSVGLEIERIDRSAPLVLDTHGLEIAEVTGEDGSARSFEIGDAIADNPRLGRPLSIELADGDASVRIAYATTEGAEALQWLAPEQTSGGKHPFLFTQGQAILTRSWIPLQDTPGVRFTYEARIAAPEPLVVVMSAEQLGRGDEGAWRFRLEHPIPSYLVALACGELESRDVSERCAVWAEPSVVDGAHWEFADTEAMIASAEELFGPYRWGRYDMIILPPAFPYGGMENPLLTFLTPTVLAGDRSLVAIIAHELAHSWSGNLVTNATWRDFWLNEGFTVYFEKRIMEAVYGADRAEMEMMLDRAGLERTIARLEPWQTVLHIELGDRHPDEGFSTVPYDKGALFLRRVEEAVGREAFDRFLTSWFDEHAFQSVTTETFLAYLEANLPAAFEAIDVDEWIRKPGLPADAPSARSDALVHVDRELERVQAGVDPSDLDTEGWVTQQWQHFLENLPESLDAAGMASLDREFRFTESGNSEILFPWLRLSIRHRYEPADPRLERFLMTVGRRKFLQPLYEELAKTEDGLARARAIYANARPRYHAVSAKTLDGIVLGE